MSVKKKYINCMHWLQNSYVNETSRHFSTHVQEHLPIRIRKIAKFKASQLRREKCYSKCLSILDETSSKFFVKIKEAHHKEWIKPLFNL